MGMVIMGMDAFVQDPAWRFVYSHTPYASPRSTIYLCVVIALPPVDPGLAICSSKICTGNCQPTKPISTAIVQYTDFIISIITEDCRTVPSLHNLMG